MADAAGSGDITAASRRAHLPLLAATFLIAASGLVYELLAGTVSSYLLGDSVYQFSLVIGLFMSAMGLGAYLSRFVDEPEPAFVGTQVALGVVGGFSAPLLFYAFVFVESYEPFLLLVCVVVGALVGLEIPLLTRLLQRHQALPLNISNVLTADYIGALAAALLFPLVLVPQLGLVATSLLFGLLNLAVAGLAAWLLRERLRRAYALALALAAVPTAAALLASPSIVGFLEGRLYEDEVVLTARTPYQSLVVTRDRDRVRLFLNGNLQFDSLDEYRYHEALVHPAMGLASRRAEILVLGGGDGMAVREVLRHPGVERVTLVDLDPAVTDLFRDNRLLRALNADSLRDPRVTIVNRDAHEFLADTAGPAAVPLYDVILIDLPDPHHHATGKLYSRGFYADAASRLARGGLLVTQATSPLYAREAFWSIERTLAATADPYRLGRTLQTVPYHAYVPTFGEWGFVLAGPGALPPWERIALPEGLRFLTPAQLSSMRAFPPDMAAVPVDENTVLTHALVRYYERGWERWFR